MCAQKGIQAVPDVTRPELKVRGRPIFFPTLHVRKTGKCHRGAWKAGWQFPDVTRPEPKVRGRPIFIPTLHVRKTGKCHRGAWKAGWQFPDVTRQENRKRRNGERKRRKACRKCHRGAGIVLFQIVLGLMCPGGLSGGGESQNDFEQLPAKPAGDAP